VKRVVLFYFLDGEDGGDDDGGDEDGGEELKNAYLIVPRPRFLTPEPFTAFAYDINYIGHRVFPPAPNI
jgi:hypothetical protein